MYLINFKDLNKWVIDVILLLISQNIFEYDNE